MPTYERRFFLSLLTKDIQKREEHMEEVKQKSQNKNAKGNRNTTISGEALKLKLKSGQIPLS